MKFIYATIKVIQIICYTSTIFSFSNVHFSDSYATYKECSRNCHNSKQWSVLPVVHKIP